MLLKECYDAFGGDYESVKERIPKDEIIEKFVMKFLTEPSYENLHQALEDGNYEEAFCAAHSLKGVCANLGFLTLGEDASLLTEFLRNKEEQQIDKEECQKLFENVSDNYKVVVDAIRKYKDA